MLELEVKVININLPSGHKLLEQCRPMYEYSWFIQQIKSYLWNGLTQDAAITLAVHDCIDAGILTKFMKNHGSEVANMLYTQWNYEEAVSVEREEAFADGREAGKAVGMAIGKAEGIAEGERQIIYDFLNHLGEIPDDIRRHIDNEQNGPTLRTWCMAASNAKSFEAFREDMGIANK